MAEIKREPKLEYSKKRKVSPYTDLSGLRPEDIDPETVVEGAYANLRAGLGAANAITDEDEDPRKAADRVFLNLAGVKNKADAIIDAIDTNVRRNHIPVYSDSSEVRQAVKRQDAENANEGDKVHWELFKRAVYDVYHQFDGITMDVLDNLTGEPFADSRMIEDNIQTWRNPNIAGVRMVEYGGRKTSRSNRLQSQLRDRVVNDGPSILERLLVYGGSLAFVWWLQKIMNKFDAKDKAQVASSKMPPGTELGPMLVQILIGIAMHMLIQGLLKQDMRIIMQNFDYPPEANVDLDEITDKAQRLVNGETVDGHTLETYPGMETSTPFIELAMSRMGEGDMETIFVYSVQWLSTHNEEGYDEWYAYFHLVDISTDIEDMLEVAPQYSPAFLAQAKKAGKKKVGVPAISRSKTRYGTRHVVEAPSLHAGTPKPTRLTYAHLTHDDSWNDYREDLLGTIQKDFLDSLQFAACSYNHSVNSFASILAMNPFVADLVCCFVRFTGSVDPGVLRAIRSMIALFANGLNFDLGGFLAKIHQRTYGDLMKKISYELLGLIDEIFYTIINDLLDWIDTIDERLLICLPIDAMLNMVLKGIEDLKKQFKDLLLTILDKFQTKGYNFDKKISILTERKWARKLLSIIDAIMMAMQSGKLCGPEDRGYASSVNNFVDDYLRAQDNPVGLYKSLQDVVNPTKDDTQTEDNDVPGVAQETQAGAGTAATEGSPKSSRLDTLDVYGLPIDLDKTIVGHNQFNTFDGTERLITENGIDLPAFKDIIINNSTWSTTVSAEQRESCLDKMTDAEISRFMQLTTDLKGL